MEPLDTIIYLVDSEYSGLEEHKPCMDYLNTLKDFEDKFEIDLSVLFKALEKGIYIFKKTKVHYVEPKYINISNSAIRIGRDLYLSLRKYGESWALTKEELK